MTDDEVLYREKLNPAWWMWLLFLGLAGSVLIALAPIATWLGILGAVIALICWNAFTARQRRGLRGVRHRVMN